MSRNRVLVHWRDEFGSGINYWSDEMTLEDIHLAEVLKLFNLWWVSDEELEKSVSNSLELDLDDPVTIRYINTLYRDAISLYIDTFLIDIKEPFRSINFKNKSEVIWFLRSTSMAKSHDRRQIYCDLVKIMFCLDEVEKKPELKNAEEHARSFVKDNYIDPSIPDIWRLDNYNFQWLEQKKENKDYYETSCRYYKKMLSGWEKAIDCTMRFRWKTKERMVVKMLGNNQGWYDIDEVIRDSIGVELEPRKNNKDRIYLLEYQYLIQCKAWDESNIDFRQKPGFFTQEELEWYQEDDELHPKFKKALKTLSALKKRQGTAKYQDAKTQWKVWVWFGVKNGCEQRTVKKWNKNQSWFSASEIVDGWKVIDAMIWLRWWVSESYVKRIVDNVAMNQEVEKDKDTILQSYLSKYRRVFIPKLNRNIYTSLDRAYEIVENAVEYPVFVVDVLKRELFGLKEQESGFTGEEIVSRVNVMKRKFPKDSLEKIFQRVKDDIHGIVNE